MRFTIIHREKRYHACAAHFHQPTNCRQRRFVCRKEINEFTMLRAVILVRQVVTPVALTNRLNKGFNPVITRMQTSAETPTHCVPDIVKNRITLIMKHRRHFLPLRGHQHGWNVDAPAMRYEKNDFFVVTTHLLDNLQTFPVNTLLNFFRTAHRQLSHHRHCLWRGGEHLIDNRFALSFATLRKAQRQIN